MRVIMLVNFFFRVLCCLTIGTALFAQDAELAKMRQEHEVAAGKLALPVEEAYVQDLLRFEKAASDKGDYTKAIMFRDERKKAQARIEQYKDNRVSSEATNQVVDKAAPLKDSVVFKAVNARPSGKLKINPTTECLENFEVGDTMTWSLPNIPVGGYEVFIYYKATKEQEGALAITEAKYKMDVPIKMTEGDQIAQVQLGYLRVSKSSGDLVIKVDRQVNGLMSFKSLELRPVMQP